MWSNIKNKYNCYKVKTGKKINWKKILIILLMLILVMLIIIVSSTVGFINNTSIYNQYEAQVNKIKYEEELKQKKIKEEEERIRKERIPKLTQKGKENLEGIYHSDSKRVFLTFDDGPSTVTPSILETLKQEKVKATFFILGTNAERFPETVKQIYEQGNYIANHGYSHTYSVIYSSPEMVLEEYNKCNDVVKNIINVPEYNSHLFRFPGGLAGGKYAEIKMQAKNILNENDILNVDWNALNGDGETNNLSIEFEMKRLEETCMDRNSIVLLMHDAQAKSVTSEALPQIIAYFRERGYEFKNFYEIIK